MDANIQIITDLKNFIGRCSSEADLRDLFTFSSTDFTRQRKLGFERLVLLLLNFFRKSYAVELAEFYNWISPEETVISKSGFCQQRMKVKGLFFECLNELLVRSFYRHYGDQIKRWQGMRLIAVDGTTVYLCDSEDIVAHFGTQDNTRSSTPMGQVVSAFDVLNGLTIKTGLYPIKTAEQSVAQHWLGAYDPDMLLIYDRGYPGFASIFLHESQEQPQPFLMRCRLSFTNEIKAFLRSDSYDQVVMFKATELASKTLKDHGFIVPVGQTIKARLVKVILDKGKTEVLVTNLFDQTEFPAGLFKELYFKRWGIETNYNTIKNHLQIEAFSGQRVTTVMQDFYITFFLANLQQIISIPSNQKLAARRKTSKHQYKINKNIAFGLMKNRIIDLFITHDPDKILHTLQQMFIRNLEPVRPDRKYPHQRKTMRLNGKFQPVKNFKRAI
jgi:hypothetical protein